jgi:hypothetical protein
MAKKKKVLVTGLSGLVGTALHSEFEERYELSSLSRYGTESLDDAHNFKGNIAKLDTMIPAFEGQHTVVHLAADRSANAEWESALRNNFVGVYNVYEAAKRTGVKRVVFGSSQHAIGGYYQDEPYKTILAGNLDQVERPFKLIDETVRSDPMAITERRRHTLKDSAATTPSSTAFRRSTSVSAGRFQTTTRLGVVVDSQCGSHTATPRRSTSKRSMLQTR